MNIETLYQEWQALQPLSPENQRRLDTKFMLEFNYNSTHMEGNTLTYGQTVSLFLHGTADGSAPMRDYEEMTAHQAALEMVKIEAATPERPLTEAFIRQLHQIMLRKDYVPVGKNFTVHAGIYKTRPNSVKTPTGEFFEYGSPEETPALMTDLVEWYNNAEKEAKLSPLEMAALFHYRYIRIHPFEDGNGRIARLLVNYILAKHGYPMIVVHESDRNGYLGVLGQCDANIGLVPSVGAHAELEQITPLVDYLEKCLERALRISIKAAMGENIEEDDDLQKKLAILAHNAQAKNGNVKRIDRRYLLDIFDNFITPFNETIRESLFLFNQFYSDAKVEYSYCADIQTTQLYKVYRLSIERDSVSEQKDKIYVIRISLESPSILIPAESKDNISIYVKYDDEKYGIRLFEETEAFRYGVLPTDSQQKEWIKKITEYLYSSIEKKVNSQK